MYSKAIRMQDAINLTSYQNYIGPSKAIPFFIKSTHKTIYIDLLQPEDVIFQQIKSTTRNEIRKALKEGCEYDSSSTIAEFVKFYNDFASGKKDIFKICDQSLSKYGNHLYLSGVKHNGQYLVMHATVVDNDEKIAWLLYSASVRLSTSHVNYIGHSNRLCHYYDMLALKKQGISTYDFGGIYTGAKDKSRVGIANFKKGFGGEITTQTNYSSVPYFLILMLLSVLNVKQLLRR
jgi:lipid II:glycine glycyltransferase (peptidoglycan interpeptide bridge formation enzyme)